MDMPSIQLLLVEDNPTDVLLLQDTLMAAQSVPFQVQHVERLDEAAQQLAAQHFDVVLLDLSLPDSLGLETFTALHARVRDIPTCGVDGPGRRSTGRAGCAGRRARLSREGTNIRRHIAACSTLCH